MNGKNRRETGNEQGKEPRRATRRDIESLLGIISSLGLTSVLIVVIGRLSTTAYFDHFGLPSSGLEFSVYDYAFRSLEVLISLVLGAIGFIVAWLNRDWLKERGPRFAAFELVVVIILFGWLVAVLVGAVPDRIISFTGVLGLSSGLALAAMIWFVVDVWEGPGPGALPGWIYALLGARWLGWLRWLADAVGGEQQVSPRQAWIHRLLGASWLGWLRWLAGIVGRGQRLLLGQATQAQDDRERNRRRIMLLLAGRGFAVLLLIGIGVGYVPYISQEFARLDARLDVKRGKLPSAILESDDPLPAEIASDADPCKSVAVRVILNQSDNTYVLHSTQCTTVGERNIETRVERGEEFAPPGSPDICKVFAIPTERLKSVEYFEVSGKVPANESRLKAVEVGLDSPFREDISTRGASDEEDADESLRLCKGEKGGRAEEDVRFFNSVWYTFAPATNGAVVAKAKASGFDPVIGIWEEPEGGVALRNVPGSGEGTGLACEATVQEMQPDEKGGENRAEMARVVAVIANIRAGTRYVATVGAQEDVGGNVTVTFEFVPDAYFFNPPNAAVQTEVAEVETTPEPGTAALAAAESPTTDALVSQAQELVPEAEIISDVGSATLELWRLNPGTYELEPLAEMSQDALGQFLPGYFPLVSDRASRTDESLPGRFTLVSDDASRTFEITDGEEQPTVLYASLLREGVWKLVPPEGFHGLTRLTSTVQLADLVLALANTAGTPLENPTVQQALLVVLEESEIRQELGYGGDLIFDRESFDEGLQIPGRVDDRESGARWLLFSAGYEEGFPIQIQVEWQSETLNAAAGSVQQRLLGIGLDAQIAQCKDACIRLFFRSAGAG